MGLRDVLLEEMKDLYSAEKQLVKALPKLAKGSEDEILSQAFTEHLEETKGHVERLEKAFELLGEKARAKHCKGMEGLVEEGSEALEEDEEGAAHDVLIAGAALRVEHYEKAAYSVCINLARTIGEDEVAELFQQTLEEEEAAAEKLQSHGLELMQQASSEDEGAEGEEEFEDDDEEDIDDEDIEDEEEASSVKKPARGTASRTAPKRKTGTRGK